MTTIAFDGETLASDSQVTVNDTKRGRAQKLFTLSDGRLMGFSGDLGRAEDLIRYLEGQETKRPNGNYVAIVVQQDGRVRVVEDCGSFDAKAPIARGSGGALAMVAMRCGKTAEEAVRIAREFDVYTGGPVQVLKYMRKPRAKRA